MVEQREQDSTSATRLIPFPVQVNCCKKAAPQRRLFCALNSAQPSFMSLSPHQSFQIPPLTSCRPSRRPISQILGCPANNPSEGVERLRERLKDDPSRLVIRLANSIRLLIGVGKAQQVDARRARRGEVSRGSVHPQGHLLPVAGTAGSNS